MCCAKRTTSVTVVEYLLFVIACVICTNTKLYPAAYIDSLDVESFVPDDGSDFHAGTVNKRSRHQSKVKLIGIHLNASAPDDTIQTPATLSTELNQVFENAIRLLFANTSTSTSVRLCASAHCEEQRIEIGGTDSVINAAPHASIPPLRADQVINAIDLLQKCADQGHSTAQFLLGVAHSFGIATPLSPAKAVTYHTFSARDHNTLGALAMALRHDIGLHVPPSCVSSHREYHRVARSLIHGRPYPTPRAVVRQQRLGHHLEGYATSLLGLDGTELLPSATDADFLAYHHQAAKNGEEKSMMSLGLIYVFGLHGAAQNGERAVTYFAQAAQEDYTPAYGALGQVYLYGVESVCGAVARNATLAKQYFVLGAEEKDPMSLAGLGYLELHPELFGERPEVSPNLKNHSYARRMFSKAADLGSAEAMYNLAIMHLEGAGGSTPRPERAMELLLRATQRKHAPAMYKLAQLSGAKPDLSPGECIFSRELFKTVASQHDVLEMMEDAHQAFLCGDHTRALLRYLILSELGYDVAHMNAAYILEDRISNADLGILFSTPLPRVEPLAGVIERDSHNSNAKQQQQTNYRHTLLHILLQRSAKQGNTAAILRLGDLYFRGEGCETNYRIAENFYEEASRHHNAEAAYNLGYMHHYGIGTTRDAHLAKRYYNLAANYDPAMKFPMYSVVAWLHVEEWWKHPWAGFPSLDEPAHLQNVSTVFNAESNLLSDEDKRIKSKDLFSQYYDTLMNCFAVENLEILETATLYFLITTLMFLLYVKSR